LKDLIIEAQGEHMVPLLTAIDQLKTIETFAYLSEGGQESSNSKESVFVELAKRFSSLKKIFLFQPSAKQTQFLASLLHDVSKYISFAFLPENPDGTFSIIKNLGKNVKSITIRFEN